MMLMKHKLKHRHVSTENDESRVSQKSNNDESRVSQKSNCDG